MTSNLPGRRVGPGIDELPGPERHDIHQLLAADHGAEVLVGNAQLLRPGQALRREDTGRRGEVGVGVGVERLLRPADEDGLGAGLGAESKARKRRGRR